MRTIVSMIVLLFGSPAFGQQPREINNSIGMKFVLIPAGTFTMGSPTNEVGRGIHETQHEVTISKPYFFGVYEVSQEQFEKVMAQNPSEFKGVKNPIENLSWVSAVVFCKELSELPEEKTSGRKYRLPTEAEWEYACRATSTTTYCFGDSVESLAEYAWFGQGRDGNTCPVGEKKPNAWGLHDTHGNVSEWCQDWHADYPSGAATDPQGPKEGSYRIYRGGSWSFDAGGLRSAHRIMFKPSVRFYSVGFRVALSPPAEQPEAASSK